jgi:hypothetical protein
MSKLEPPVDWRHAGRPGDDPDGLLRAYFRAELPAPWPAWRRPDDRARSAGTPAVPARSRTWTGARRRLAMAAAGAVLLLSTLLLSGRFHGSPPPTRFGGPQEANPYWKRPDWKMKESLEQEQDQPTKLRIDVYP